MTRILLEFLGDIIFALGWVLGAIKYRFGVIRPIPKRYRSPRWEKDGDSSS